jgi:hypothetical protein
MQRGCSVKLPDWMYIGKPLQKTMWVLFIGIILCIPLDIKYPDVPWHAMVLIISCVLYVYWDINKEHYDPLMIEIPPK